MDRWIDYIDAGGTFAWLAAAAGAFGVLTVLLALPKQYKRAPAIFAMEMGFIAFALGGVGWFINSGKADEARRYANEKLGGAPQASDGPRNTASSAVAEEVRDLIEDEAQRTVTRPLWVAGGAGGAAVVLGGVLLLMAGSAGKRS